VERQRAYVKNERALLGRHRRPADPARRVRRGVVHRHHRRLERDALHTTARDAELTGDLAGTALGGQYLLDRMTILPAEHPPAPPHRRGPRRRSRVGVAGSPARCASAHVA